jgi:ABC-type dipeptide/oligopeptide/nickel transport system permease subunit
MMMGASVVMVAVFVPLTRPMFEAEGTYNWSAVVSMGHLAEGVHTIEFRSWDGLQHSDVLSYEFTIEWEGQGVQDEGGDNLGRNTFYLLLAGISLLIAGVVLILFILVMKRRNPPDS